MNTLTVTFCSWFFILYPESKGFQETGHDDCQNNHSDQVESHEINSCKFSNHHSVSIHQNEPIIHNGQLEQRHYARNNVVESV